jgi:tetratricopeptide (TPR) repeat protein
MNRKLFTALAFIVVLAATVFAQDDVEKRFTELRDAYGAAQTPLEKYEVLHTFLSEYPESRYSVGILREAVRLLSDELQDPDKALSLIASTLAKINDARTRFEVKKVQVGLYGKTGKSSELRALVSELSKERDFKYSDNSAIASAAVATGDWELALKHFEAALTQATPETVWAELPENSRDADRVQSMAKSRKAESLSGKGWALFNLGQTEEALAAFGAAEKETDFFYAGFPESDLFLYWGKALLKTGKVDEAMEKLAPGAVIGGNQAELETLKEAFIAKNGSAAGYEDFIWQQRVRLAKPVAEFALPDYEGLSHSFSELRGEVTLLNFWFPT